MREHIQHPRRLRVAAEDVPLEPHAVDGVADGRLGAGQVGARLVVVAADDLDPARGHQGTQVLPILREGVEIRLQVVDLGQHELVVAVLPGLVQVGADQLERGPDVGQRAVLVRQGQPGLGELALGVPPDRVVVEVADHPHRPAWLGDGDVGLGMALPGLAGDRDRHPACATRLIRRGDLDRHFEGSLFALVQSCYAERAWLFDSRPLNVHRGGHGRGGEHPRPLVHQRDPQDLQRALHCPHEQVCRFNPGDPHLFIVTRPRLWITTRRRASPP